MHASLITETKAREATTKMAKTMAKTMTNTKAKRQRPDQRAAPALAPGIEKQSLALPSWKNFPMDEDAVTKECVLLIPGLSVTWSS